MPPTPMKCTGRSELSDAGLDKVLECLTWTLNRLDGSVWNSLLRTAEKSGQSLYDLQPNSLSTGISPALP